MTFLNPRNAPTPPRPQPRPPRTSSRAPPRPASLCPSVRSGGIVHCSGCCQCIRARKAAVTAARAAAASSSRPSRHSPSPATSAEPTSSERWRRPTFTPIDDIRQAVTSCEAFFAFLNKDKYLPPHQRRFAK